MANEAYKKREDRKIEYINAYAGHVFTYYTYIFEKGFECSVSTFIALHYILLYIKLMIFHNVYSFTNLSMEVVSGAVNPDCNNGHGHYVMNFVNH